MAFTLDARPHVIGDLVLLAGTIVQADGGTTVDISEHISKIIFADLQGKIGAGPPAGVCIVSDTSIQFPGIHPSITGTLNVIVIGKR